VQVVHSKPEIDLMIEAKDKEQAVLQLYKKYGLYPVDEGEHAL
jgi:UV DNA damage repair endonuclease